MLLASLRIAHSAPRPVTYQIQGEFFRLDTCQRTLWIYEALPGQAADCFAGVEILEGIDAYAFLLRVATGLESQVLGETDIFGQLKEGWARFEKSSSRLARELLPWIQRVFEDTKEIRSQYLQSAGSGSSYGTLVRRVLKRHGLQAGEPVLLMGAGQIARTVAPFLSENPLWIQNRTESRARELARPHDRVIREADAAQAWDQARFIVICTPEDAQRELLLAARAQGKCVVHLGCLRSQAGFLALDDLFQVQKEQGEASSRRFERALKACDEKALLRSLPGSAAGSATLPHGWEDLAQFS
jgi:hypothetical protein